jgi:hypothetical protein
MTGVATWEGTVYPYALEFTPVFSGVRDAQYVAFCGVFCRLFLWTLSFILANTFSVLRNTASQFPIGFFKPFLHIFLLSSVLNYFDL